MDKEGYGGLNELFGEWYGDGVAVTALSPEDRKNSFIEFVRSKLDNEVYFKLVEKSIIDYANNDLNALFGGNRRNKRSINKRKTRKRKRM